MPLLPVAISALSLISAPYHHAVTMKISYNGKDAGLAVLTQSLSSNGTFGFGETISRKAAGKTQGISYLEVIDKRGLPVRYSIKGVAGSSNLNVAITFGPKGASVQASSQAKSRKVTVPYPKGVLIQVSAFWFVTMKPKVGAVAAFEEFDMNSGRWKHRRDIYECDVTITYHGKKVKAHKITHLDGFDVEDDFGLPYQAVYNGASGKTVYERV